MSRRAVQGISSMILSPGKVAKSKGDVRRGAAEAANCIVRGYSMMISLADRAERFPR